MYSRVVLIWRYLRYYLMASNGKGHGIHSPFVFDFVTRILNDDRHFYAYAHIENLRRIVYADPRIRYPLRKATPEKYNRMLFRAAAYYAPDTILVTGTSPGISTAYLAAAHPARVIAIEKNDEMAEWAKSGFDKLKLDNIKLMQGDPGSIIPQILPEIQRVDMLYLNTEFASEAIGLYQLVKSSLHENSIFVVEGIHTGATTEQAWKAMQMESGVTLTIDLFHTGFVFFRKENKTRQHFTIRF